MFESLELVARHLGDGDKNTALVIMADSEHQHMAIDSVTRLDGLGLIVDTPGHRHARVAPLQGVLDGEFGHLDILDRCGIHRARSVARSRLGKVIFLTQPQGDIGVMVLALHGFGSSSLGSGGTLLTAFLLTLLACLFAPLLFLLFLEALFLGLCFLLLFLFQLLGLLLCPRLLSALLLGPAHSRALGIGLGLFFLTGFLATLFLAHDRFLDILAV